MAFFIIIIIIHKSCYLQGNDDVQSSQTTDLKLMNNKMSTSYGAGRARLVESVR